MTPQILLRSRRYRMPAEPFLAPTDDGVRLAGHRLGDGEIALVFCHGFLGWHRKARLVPFQEQLARWFTVYAFDFRGHGASGGRSTFGLEEITAGEVVVSEMKPHARASGDDIDLAEVVRRASGEEGESDG